MRGTDVGREKTMPFRIEPEGGKVSEYTAKCSNIGSMAGPSIGIHTSRAESQLAIGC